MTGGQMMVVLIVAIVMIASVLRAKYGHRGSRHGKADGDDALHSAEAARLREDVKALKDRVVVLERIATDKNHLLEQEFERLRDERR